MPGGQVVLTHHHLVRFSEFGGKVTLFVIPQRITVCRVHTGIAVDVEFSQRTTNHPFGGSVGQFVFLHTVIEFLDFILVIGYIGTEIPNKIPQTQYVCIDGQFHTHVGHHTDVVPTETVVSFRIRLWHFHQHVTGTLVVEFQIYIETLEESQMKS